jgi:hypothetical protein
MDIASSSMFNLVDGNITEFPSVASIIPVTQPKSNLGFLIAGVLAAAVIAGFLLTLEKQKEEYERELEQLRSRQYS